MASQNELSNLIPIILKIQKISAGRLTIGGPAILLIITTIQKNDIRGTIFSSPFVIIILRECLRK